MNNKQLMAILGVNFIVFLQFYYYMFYFLPFYHTQYLIVLDTLILFLLEIFITTLVTWTHYITAMKNPGFEERIFEFADQENQIDKNQIEKNTENFQKQKNSINKFLSLSGHNILVENCDKNLLIKCKQMNLDQIKKEKSKVHLDFINKTLKCLKCGVIKYPRTHHCSTCKKCVKRFDHHCVWIGNCIGLQNTRYFIQFLFYVSLGSFYQFFIYLYFYILQDTKLDQRIDNIFKGICACGLMLFLALGCFFLYHFSNALDNVTNLEDQIEGFRQSNNFNKGKLKNFQQIFGSNFLYMFFPLEFKLK